MKAGLKPSLATTTAKASECVIAVPLGLEDARLAEFGYEAAKYVGR